MSAPTQRQNKLPAEPQMKDLLDLHTKEILLKLNCHALATVQAFDSSKQTVSATINYKKTFNKLNKTTGLYDIILSDYPILIDCPVVILSGGPCALTFPIAQGDECLVCFNDRDIDNWFQGSTTSAPSTARLHSLADGIALIGPRNKGRSLSGYDSARAVLKDFVGGAMVGVGGQKVKVANNTTTLNTLLQDLITQLQALTVTCAAPGNPSSPPINSVAIALIGTQLAGLLE